ncbi:hypothetical protein BCR44DRAFT_372001 [Catenaria anguillulae PL171]|uniref:Uncharacterized protein n=1 Tax=Catenaria anguillulae PL171 TaxID=765915 RepID=A0A1Y2H6V8_9FUNG|nr:hypothetical protein BCR44DRAFT_372001 [Catenaria anguillulae PL171]
MHLYCANNTLASKSRTIIPSRIRNARAKTSECLSSWSHAWNPRGAVTVSTCDGVSAWHTRAATSSASSTLATCSASCTPLPWSTSLVVPYSTALTLPCSASPEPVPCTAETTLPCSTSLMAPCSASPDSPPGTASTAPSCSTELAPPCSISIAPSTMAT